MTTMPPTIPPATSITYLAEGAANVVYTLGKPFPHEHTERAASVHDDHGPTTPLPTELQIWEVDLPHDDFSFLDGKLLRLRKDLPTATSVLDSQAYYEQLITPLFSREELVEQSIVGIPEELVSQLTSVLVAMDDGGYRPQKRHGVYLSNECYGMLVTDMSPRTGRDLITVELKPKWLAQSPSAPSGSRRCRTCALRAMKEADGLATHDSSSEYAFCPLNLISNERSKVAIAVKAILRGRSDAAMLTVDTETRVVDHLLESSLLQKLRLIQLKLDSKGVWEADAHDKNFLTAMTLRDCTIYLRIPVSSDSIIEARLGDLDLKSPSRADYWKRLDQRLIDDGWYEEIEQVRLSSPTACLLQT